MAMECIATHPQSFNDNKTKLEDPEKALCTCSTSSYSVAPETSLTDPSIFDAKVINQQSNHIPQEFVWPDHEKPSTNVQPLQVPLIDLAGFLSGDSFLVSEATRLVAEAAQQHGFFLVTNHGVDETLLSRAYMFMDSYFNSPACEKKKAQRTWGESAGYGSSFLGRFSSSLPWKETLSFEFSPEEKCHSQTVKDFVTKKMGDGYEEFGKFYQEYGEAMSSLSLKVLELLGMSLGIDRRHFRDFFEDNESILRLNNYPRCKQPDLALGTGPHCDPISITILHQDQVGGLQVLVDNHWHSITPSPQAFVVNIGDTFMALTNGRYKSCLHQAVVNSESGRRTITFFLSPKGDRVVKPSEELVMSGKREYPDFTWSTFLEFTQKQYRVDVNTLEGFTNWLENRRSF